MRDFVCFNLNGKEREVRGRNVFMQMSDYLRYVCLNTGTKIVCAEGDCGACSVLVRFPYAVEESEFCAVNSCIAPVFLFDGCHVVSVEGLKNDGELHPVQEAMVRANGSQCGFCTPGFVVAMAALFEDRKTVDAQTVKNHLTGNLCRCTGYFDIVQAALQVEGNKVVPVRERYGRPEATEKLKRTCSESVGVESDGLRLRMPVTLNEALEIKTSFPGIRIVSGATDLGVQVNKERVDFVDVLNLNQIEELHRIEVRDDRLWIGAKASLAAFQKQTRGLIPELYRFLHIFASPQIKNIGTVVGNIVNASPIADTTPCLMALEGRVHLAMKGRKREVALEDFYQGYKKLNMEPKEIVEGVDLVIPSAAAFQRYYKVSQRRDLDISAVNVAFILDMDGGRVRQFRMAVGGVGPVTMRLKKVEQFVSMQSLTAEREFSPATVERIKEIIIQEITPISDVRGSKEFRSLLLLNLFDQFLGEWKSGSGGAQ